MSEDGEQIDPIPMEATAFLTIALCVLPFHTVDKKVKKKKTKTLVLVRCELSLF